MVQTLPQENKFEYKAKKFVVWLFVVSSTIMFGGWTSYYIVFAASKHKGHGLVLPQVFNYSTAVLILSSIALFLASRALRNGDRNRQRLFLWLTLLLGLVFGVLQVEAWGILKATGAFFVNNNAAISMIYVLSLFHLFHIFAGICLIINSLVGSYRAISVERATYRQEIAAIFWHFIDILWIYLYVFLLLNS
ncbi:MAG: cytochrome c oxidase subunit 3 [Pedobacter sp.]|nr:cytochrome c oxidase subunit 3 [Pedobacter sp.]MDQ8053033.1 cytochrome c oxidase subunit 3 [Pedobacter sp.]